MAVTVAQACDIATIIRALTSRGASRADAIDALVHLAAQAYQRMAAGLRPDQARALLEQHWPDLTATTWTDETGRVWDLTVGYHDANGDAWAPIGWLAGFDAVPVPYLECRGLAADFQSVLEQYGPLTPDPADGA